MLSIKTAHVFADEKGRIVVTDDPSPREGYFRAFPFKETTPRTLNALHHACWILLTGGHKFDVVHGALMGNIKEYAEINKKSWGTGKKSAVSSTNADAGVIASLLAGELN